MSKKRAVNTSSPAELAAIFQKVAGTSAGLFLPVRLTVSPASADEQPGGPEFMVPPTYAEVSGRPSSARDLHAALLAIDTIQTIYQLVGLNILLESGKDASIEHAAVEQYVRPEFRLGSTVLPSNPQPHYRFIFNRVGVLLALKSLLGLGVRPTALAPGGYGIGDLMLRANEFISGDSFHERTSAPTALEFAAELIPAWDLTNPRDLAYGMARIHRMIEYLAGSDPIVVQLEAKTGIVPSCLRFGGLLLNEFLAVAFGLYSYVNRIPPAILLNRSSEIGFKSDQVFGEVKFPTSLLEQFLAKTSIRLDDLQGQLASGVPWDCDRYVELMNRPDFRSDFLAFRQRPLLMVEEDKYIILDVQFLAELLHSGVYFDLLFSLPKDKREDFMSLWGRIFELWLVDLLGHFYPDSAGILQVDIPFTGGQVDALLDLGDVVVIFEFKHFLLPHDVKYGRDPKLLEKELRKKLFTNQKGKQKTIRQLATAAAAVRSGSVGTLLGKESSRPKAAIFPVVVIAEASLEAPFVNHFLNELFQGEIVGVDVKPLTVMSVQELEDTLPAISHGQMTWRELFESRFHENRVSPFSVHQARYNLAAAKGVSYLRNQFMLDQFAAIFAHIRSLYGGGANPNSA